MVVKKRVPNCFNQLNHEISQFGDHFWLHFFQIWHSQLSISCVWPDWNAAPTCCCPHLLLPSPVAAVTVVPSDVVAEPPVDLSSSAEPGLVAEPAVLALHSEVVKIVNNLLQSEMGRSKVVFIV